MESEVVGILDRGRWPTLLLIQSRKSSLNGEKRLDAEMLKQSFRVLAPIVLVEQRARGKALRAEHLLRFCLLRADCLTRSKNPLGQ